MSTLETNAIGKYSGNNVSVDDSLNLKSYTTTQRDALTSVAGDMIYNTTDSKVQVYNGSAWEELGGLPVFTINYLAVGGGGAGSGTGPYHHYAGGGGAGGFLTNLSTATPAGGGSLNPYLAIKKDGTTTYQVTVGAGGTAGTGVNTGASGNNTEFAGILSLGGGKGGSRDQNGSLLDGASGGGGGKSTGGSGTTNQGFGGGSGSFTGSNSGYGGGGGGASSAGSNGSSGTGGTGGSGLSITITNASKDYCGGGGGAGGTGQGSSGGAGATNGAAGAANAPGNATNNTGSGGGGAASLNGQTGYTGGNGGSGEVVLRWATADATIGATRTGLTDGGVQTDGSDSYIVFTQGTGTVTFS